MPSGAPSLVQASASEAPFGFHNSAFGSVGCGASAGTLMRHHQPMPAVGARTAFMRVAAVHDDRGVLEAVVKECLVGLDHQGRRNMPIGIGEHAVVGDDGEAFDAGGARHGVTKAAALEDRQRSKCA